MTKLVKQIVQKNSLIKVLCANLLPQQLLTVKGLLGKKKFLIENGYKVKYEEVGYFCVIIDSECLTDLYQQSEMIIFE